ncbi:Putative voltage-gated potassium channel subunit beta [Fusarium oxysporum f. sp. cubense race 1]|uniref:Putative voltage-gated potassium channel subunit beta n=1 Tax=Fusarium oxysporum f. sp. cubense (strain race 1) TaxID=1229664 RepID=N4TJ61_FUSC1|nr:Putative voltage-gated potassium channel subunit beta [Fusarium oxysporum f. sp. cubense race 1]
MAKPEDIPEMEYRFLGRSGLQVSAISLGGWLTYERTFECMKAAYDCGVNFFDCAEEYSNGESEIVMGEAIKKFGWKRNDLVVSTKLYWGGAFGDNPVNNKGLSRKHIVEGINGALKRLDLEYVDLIYAHRPDRRTPMEEIVRAFNHIIDQGKIAQAWRYADKLGLIGPIMEQPAYNMLDRVKVEQEYAHLYREVGLGLTVFSPMRQGILSGKYKIQWVNGFWKQTGKDTWTAIIEQVNQLKPIADRLGFKQSQLALAWVLSNKNVSSAITGASSPEQVYENVRAVAVVKKLTPEILKEIDVILNNKPPEVVERF